VLAPETAVLGALAIQENVKARPLGSVEPNASSIRNFCLTVVFNGVITTVGAPPDGFTGAAPGNAIVPTPPAEYATPSPRC